MNPIEIKRGDSFKKLSNYLLKGKNEEISPEKILEGMTQHSSVFTEQDIARYVSKALDEEVTMKTVMDNLFASKELVVLRSNDEADEKVYYSTWEMVSIERSIMEASERLAKDRSHGVQEDLVTDALKRADSTLRESVNASLSREQIEAVKHVTGNEKIAVVSGLAGAGKSTMLDAARESWEAQGYNVYGAALAGKAAEGLQESSGIRSRTLASFEMGWKNGYGELSKGDVLVIDEAGMVGSRQLSHFISAAEKSDAKIVLVGDSEQLQAIGAGAPFRQSVEELGAAKLENVLRQRQTWQQEATRDFATNRTAEALNAYETRGDLVFAADANETLKALVSDYLIDVKNNPDQSRLALAHRRIDVKQINEQIRQGRKDVGQIDAGIDYTTRDGKREFSVGDRLIFLENNRDLNVKNGMLGTVTDIQNGQITTCLDGKDGRSVTVTQDEYDAIDHGYATTIHKSQGVSVDRSFVMASYTMDRHLSYVAMSRHREDAKLYVNDEQFATRQALVNRLGREGTKKTTLDFDVDVRTTVQPSIQTDEEPQKVGWTQTYNLGGAADSKAWIKMKATADSAQELKVAAGLAKGKKTTKPVYHYSVTWPETDKPKLTEELQRLAVKESLEALGLEDYQALAVQHLDGKPHVHIMVNLIHPETGLSASTSVMQANGKKASKLTYSHKKLRQWANRFEKQHNLQITETSHQNQAKREAGEVVKARRKSRVVYEREKREGKAADPTNVIMFATKERTMAAGIGESSRAKLQKHRENLERFEAEYQTRMQKIYQQRDDALLYHQQKFQAKYKPKWTALARAHHERVRDFEVAEAHATSLFFNSVSAFMQVRRETKSTVQGLYAATSGNERRQLIERLYRVERKSLSIREQEDTAAYLEKEVHQPFDKKVAALQSRYLRLDKAFKKRKSRLVRKTRDQWQKNEQRRAAEYQQSQGIDASVAAQQNQGLGQSLGLRIDP